MLRTIPRQIRRGLIEARSKANKTSLTCPTLELGHNKLKSVDLRNQFVWAQTSLRRSYVGSNVGRVPNLFWWDEMWDGPNRSIACTEFTTPAE